MFGRYFWVIILIPCGIIILSLANRKESRWPKKILVIDDDPLVLRSIRNLLTREGYELECAQSSEEAQQKLISDSFNLIICDIKMPQQDGISLIQKTKGIFQQSGKPEIPFIFITGYASEEAPIDAVKLGARDYILKPFDLDELLSSVRKYIQ